MKNNFTLFVALWFALGILLSLQGCGSDESGNTGNTNTITSIASTPSNTNEAVPIDDVRPVTASPHCKNKKVVPDDLAATCSQINAEVVEYLKNKALLVFTLRGVNKTDESDRPNYINKLNNLDPKATSPQNENNLSKTDIPLIAEEVKKTLDADPPNIPLSEDETKRIAEKVRADTKQTLLLLFLFSLLILFGLVGLGWLYISRQFSRVKEEITNLPHLQMGSNPPNTGSGKDIQQLNLKGIEHLQTYLINLSDIITEQSEKNAEELNELKELINDSSIRKTSKSTAIASNLSAEITPRVTPVQPSESVFLVSLMKGENPLSVDGYKERFGANSTVLTFDRYGEKLIETSGNGEFLLIRLESAKGIVVPNYISFSKPELFSSYYQNFYERVGFQTMGDVWIKKPAAVRYSDEGWELIEKGELELR